MEIDETVMQLVDSYRHAKAVAARAALARSAIEAAGHYDRDATTPRGVVEDTAVLEERRAAIAVADAVLAWVDRHKG